MLKQIADAMKISLKECASVEDPTEYTKALLGVLTRYKTNIFKMIYKDGDIWQDPKELIQFRIGTTFRTRAGFDKKPMIIDRGQTLLYINALIPDPTGPVNKENVRNLTVSVNDIVDIDKLLNLTPNCYKSVALQREEGDEDDISIPGLYHSLDRGADEVYVFTIQLNSGVDQAAEEEAYIIKSLAMSSDARLSLNEIKLREDNERKKIRDAAAERVRLAREEEGRQIQLSRLRGSLSAKGSTGPSPRSFLG